MKTGLKDFLVVAIWQITSLQECIKKGWIAQLQLLHRYVIDKV
ncbi:hypothetical protein [Nonlabens dokdonensis]|nr:hypothetical protein [Nonlabens dokdonensis]